MINLLPIEHKSEIRAARANVVLLRYIMIIICAALVLGGLIGGSYIALNTAKQNAEEKASENARRLVAFQQIKTDADSFRSDLTTAKTILDSSPSFSTLIYDIAATVPKNTVLDSLTLDPVTLGTATTLNASAKSFDDATKLKDALTQNSRVFSGVQIISIRNATDGGADAYPVKVALTVTINKVALQ